MNMKNISKGQFNFGQKLFVTSKGIIKSLMAILVIVIIWLYYQTEIFSFSESKIDTASDFYNPYTSWNKEKVFKANFHAHAQAWKGITSGHDSEEDIKNEYLKLGFKVAAVSNYHSISAVNNPDFIEIPCYEHGFNVSKTHLLAIDAKKTDNLDFPFGQTTSQKQTRILNLKKTASLVALTHPGLRGGFTMDDLKYLKGYDLMEVLSPYFESFELWDYALNKGNLSWILANDDTHDLKKQPAGRFFNVISSENKSKFGVIKSLKSGNHVAFSSEKGITDVFLEKIIVDKYTIKYRFSGNINRVRLVRNGQMYTTDPKGEIVMNDQDKYVRFEVVGEKSTLYTNPIYRIKAERVASFVPHKIDVLKTFAYRLCVLSVGFLVFFFIFNKQVSKRFKKWKPSF